ncbi:hypothetical protein K788_0005136 (plasmid) [Paraburkholderia caribensis MBA4]|uniref:Uncharacterized protein n=1 Tax=Paraburkholderia caribensis MBA4 TaxID=1323664 RepID=A0A0P0RKZ4_9BURK|nr:hypothetical protein K788_0005136 [Paraburkholderia caribensis MBA4]
MTGVAGYAVRCSGLCRWHPRIVSVLHTLLFGVFAFALASANC